MAASPKRSIPLAPMGLVDSTPPLMFTGRRPVISVSPLSVIFQPSPLGAKPRFSSHIGSNQLNGTYISTQSISSTGEVIPALRHRSAAQASPAPGLTVSRPANVVGSTAHRGGVHPGHRPVMGVSTSPRWPAPWRTRRPLDGQVSTKRTGSHSMGDSSAFSSVQPASWRWA